MTTTSLVDLKDLIEELSGKIDIFIKEKQPLQENQNIEAIAAKIINDIAEKIDKCEGIILERIKDTQQIINLAVDDHPEGTSKPKYSPPNHMVGNVELGSSGNPKALIWPFK